MTDISSTLRDDKAHEFETLEARLEASRAAIRSRLASNAGGASDTAGGAAGPRAATKPTSWSSLIFDLVAPTAKETASKHPWGLIAGSAAIGAYLAWSRPWRGVGGVVGPMLVGAVLRNLGSGTLSGGSLLNYFSRRRASNDNGAGRDAGALSARSGAARSAR